MTRIGREPTEHVTLRVPRDVIRQYKTLSQVGGQSWRQLMRNVVIENLPFEAQGEKVAR